MPSDLKELASAMATYERLISEIPVVEKTFPPITDKMLTLGKGLHVEHLFFECVYDSKRIGQKYVIFGSVRSSVGSLQFLVYGVSSVLVEN